MAPTRLGVDVGGTFTDLVALSEGGVTTSKVPSTPRDQSIGVMNAIGASGVEAGALDALAHGMTVATNALHRKPRVGVGRSVQLRLPLCRGSVRGSNWRLPEVQARYRGHFSPFINERIATIES